MRNRRLGLALALALAAPGARASGPALAGPVVLELFTSQGCSSCPPADALLARLAHSQGLIALDLHVDYWNDLGWHDPFATAAFTARQRAYGAALGDDEIYTPELVVNGAAAVVGSDPAAVAAAIAAAARPRVGLRLRRAGGQVALDVDGGGGDATIFLAGAAAARTTRVRGGENGGRTLHEANVVLSLAPVGHWAGRPLSLTAALPPGDIVIALLQARDGRIFGAAQLAAGP